MRRKIFKILTAATLIFTALIAIWYVQQCKPYESNSVAETSWQETGKPMVAIANVTDQAGHPLSGVYVDVMNDSGGNGEATDVKGVATIQLGEGEFNGLRLNNETVVNCPYSGTLPGSPSASHGLQIKIVVKNKAAIALP